MLGGAGTHKLSRCIHWCLPVPPREYGHVLSGGVTMLTMATYMHVRVRLWTTGVKMYVTWLCGLHDGSQSADQYGLPSAYVYTSVFTQAQLKWPATIGGTTSCIVRIPQREDKSATLPWVYYKNLEAGYITYKYTRRYHCVIVVHGHKCMVQQRDITR